MIPKKLLDEINRWITDKRYGSISINFQGGKIVNLNRIESLKIDMLVIENPTSSISFSSAGNSLIK